MNIAKTLKNYAIWLALLGPTLTACGQKVGEPMDPEAEKVRAACKNTPVAWLGAYLLPYPATVQAYQQQRGFAYTPGFRPVFSRKMNDSADLVLLVPPHFGDTPWEAREEPHPQAYFHERVVKGVYVNYSCSLPQKSFITWLEQQLSVSFQHHEVFAFNQVKAYFHYARLSPCVQVFVFKAFLKDEDKFNCQDPVIKRNWRVYFAFDMSQEQAVRMGGFGGATPGPAPPK